MDHSLRHPYIPRSTAEAFFCNSYPGYRLTTYSGDVSCQRLTLILEPTGLCKCPNCGNFCKPHATLYRDIRCAPCQGYPYVYLRLPVRQVRCSCGCRRMEVIRWLDSHSRISNKLIALVQADLREGDTVKAVSQRYHLDWQTVKAVDKLQLDHCFGEIELGNVRHLIMDEFAIQKGHKYATIVMDAETHRALWVCKGKAGADVKAFFELLKEKKLADKIRSVSMDMNACFPSLVRHYCHNATVLYDLFHVLQMFTRNVLVPAKKHCQDAVLKRLDSLNTPPKPAKKKGEDATPKEPVVISKEILEQHAQERKRLTEQKELLTSCQWVLVRSFNDLDNDDTEKLQKLRDNNQLLADLYPIADLLRNLWTVKNRCEALQQIRHLMGLCWAIARTHGFKPAHDFGDMLLRRLDGIINCGRYGYGSGPLEGSNNAIKVLKRTAYGFLDFDYFRLKILARLPGRGYARSTLLYGRLNRSLAVTKAGLFECCFHTNPR